MRHLLLAAMAALGHCASTILEAVPPSEPRGWTRVADAHPDQSLKLRIALRQPEEALSLFERTLYQVSDPANASVDEDGDWVNLELTVREASTLFEANFGLWSYGSTKAIKVRALKYSVPEELVDHISFIGPNVRFGQIKPQRSHIFEVVDTQTPEVKTAAAIPPQQLDATACNVSITPECLRALYNVGSYQADPTQKSLFGVSGFLEQWAKHDQLELFVDKYAPYAADNNFTAVGVNGGVNLEGPTEEDDVEANLDIQYTVSMAYKTPITYFSTGGRGPLVPDLDQPDPNDVSNEPYLEFFSYLLKLPDSKLPQTLTTSYGEDEQSVPEAYAKKVCQMIGQLGARGTSVIFSSGDTGVGSACQTNDGKNTTRFLPIFPASCPYVTSVGGTRYVQPEHAVSFSSGGFSDIWPRPLYQEKVVSTYLRTHLKGQWKGFYNPAGRGFPDVAAQGVRYHVYFSNKNGLVSGTSASAPTFAALISLLNNARLTRGIRPLGFLNPWLYSVGVAGKGFTDIVDGGSTGCTGTDIYTGLPAPFVPHASWNATDGWDPVTGLGTPLFNKLFVTT